MPGYERRPAALPVLTTSKVAARRFSHATILAPAWANL